MVEIQAALPAKFMLVAGAHKTGSKDASVAGLQLASFIGVLKSQLVKSDTPADVSPLALSEDAVGKTLLAGQDEKDVVLSQEPEEALQPQAVSPEANLPLSATAVTSMGSAMIADGVSQQSPRSQHVLPDADHFAAASEIDAAPGGAKSAPNAKSEVMPKAGGAAISAVAGQALPQAAEIEQGDVPILVLGDHASGDGMTAPGPLPSGFMGAAVPATTSPISLLHPFDQALRQAETKINAAIEAPLRSPAFAAELGDKVVWLATRQGQFADLSLNPPQMGALEVRLSLSGSDASAQFFSANPVVREVIDAALPRLREMMAQAGINLGETEVREQAFERRDASDTPGRTLPQEGEISVHQAAIATVSGGRSTGSGLVDLYI